MKNLIAHLLSPWFVIRQKHESTLAALRTAHCLIVKHHEVGVMNQPWGGFCPVCHHKDGTEPEMDAVIAALSE